MKKPSRRPRDRQQEQAPRYWTGAHTTHKLRCHLVLLPKHNNAKYRKRVLKGDVASVPGRPPSCPTKSDQPQTFWTGGR